MENRRTKNVYVKVGRDRKVITIPFSNILDDDFLFGADTFAVEDAHESTDPNNPSWVVRTRDGRCLHPEDFSE